MLYNLINYLQEVVWPIMQLPSKFQASNGTQKIFRPLFRFGLAHFEGQNSRKRLDIFGYIFETTWKFHDFSKLGSPVHPQLPFLGYHKPFGGAFIDWEPKIAKIKGQKWFFPLKKWSLLAIYQKILMISQF